MSMMITASAYRKQAQPAATAPPAASTWNSADKSAAVTLSSGDTVATAPNDSTQTGVRGTASHNAGKYYFEIVATGQVDGDWGGGLATSGANLAGAINVANIYVYRASGTAYFNGSNVGSPPSLASGGVVGVAVDFDAGKIWLSKNNVWVLSGNPGAGTSPVGTFTAGTALYPLGKTDNSAGAPVWTLRTTSAAFTGTIPSGFTEWG